MMIPKFKAWDFEEKRMFLVELIDWARNMVIEKNGYTHLFDNIRLIQCSKDSKTTRKLEE